MKKKKEYDKYLFCDESDAMNVPPFSYDKATELFEFLDKQIEFGLGIVKGCDGTLSKTDAWIRENGFSEDERCHILCFLRNNGGYCDCEVLMNVSKPENWVAKKKDENEI